MGELLGSIENTDSKSSGWQLSKGLQRIIWLWVAFTLVFMLRIYEDYFTLSMWSLRESTNR